MTIDITTNGSDTPEEDAQEHSLPTRPASQAPNPSTTKKVLLDDIKERKEYVRNLRDDHIRVLATSIATIGLEQPLVLLKDNHLIAGRHRLHALRLFRKENPSGFEAQFPDGKIPAQVFDLGKNPKPSDILALEMTENSARMDFTYEEVARVAEDLKKEGFICKRGRPGKDDRPLGPELCRRFGMSEATMHRVLSTVKRTEKLSGESLSAAGDESKEGPTPLRTWEEGDKGQVNSKGDSARIVAARKAVQRMSTIEVAEFGAWFDRHRQERTLKG